VCSTLRHVRTAALAGLLAAIALGGSPGCSKQSQERLRRRTYPPNFNFIPRDRLESTMWQLADRVSRLDELVREGEPKSGVVREEAIALLADMERISTALGLGEWPSNHPRVSQNVGMFRQELAAARRALEMEPPSYFLAGSVSGACTNCHRAP